jgi:hypothetical protein
MCAHCVFELHAAHAPSMHADAAGSLQASSLVHATHLLLTHASLELGQLASLVHSTQRLVDSSQAGVEPLQAGLHAE